VRRSGLATAATITLGVLIGVSALGIGVGMSRATQRDSTTPQPTIVPATIPPTATPIPTAAATSAAPTRTPLPIIVSAYTYAGKRYAAVTAPVGFMYAAPFAGNVRIAMYQLIDGQIRIGSNVPSQPFFPYLTLTAADRRIIYRPGAFEKDTELLVEDGAKIETGKPLFKVAGTGPSSWQTFYDPSVTAQLIVSLASLPGDRELDPVPLFAGP
jgi:hypothetical protein